MKRLLLALAPFALLAQPAAAQQGYEGLVASHAAANGIPASLVHRVIMRESRYNPRVVGRGGAMGMMQIKLATARSMGYTGSAEGLLDANTNMTYAVKYLAGAYRAAGGNESRAVGYYAGGYYYAAKRQGWAADTRAASAQTANPFAALSTLAPEPQPRRLTRAERRAQAQAANPFSAFAFNTTQPRRLTRAERRAAQRVAPASSVASNQP